MFSGAHKSIVTQHGHWTQDGHVFMEEISHLKLIVTLLLLTCRYITGQMQTPVQIDVNKFTESFSIKADDGGNICPPSWIAGEDNSVTFTSATSIIPDFQSSSHSPSPKPFSMDDYILCRQAEAIRWINLQEKRASIIARLQPVTPEEYQSRRDAVNSESGPICRKKGMKFHLIISGNAFIAIFI